MRRVCVTAVTALLLLLFAGVAAAALSLTVTGTDAVVGGEIQATADLSESPGATGEVTFEVFAADDPTCSEPPLDQSTATVSGEGQYASEEFAPPAPGTYTWSAHYSGDGGNEPADSECSAASEVSKAAPALTGSASDGVVGTAIHDEVAVTGGFFPTGEVTFSVYAPTDTTCSTPLATDGVPLDEGAAASPDHIAQQAGEFRWTANYSGDAGNEAVSLSCGAANQSSLVAKASPSLSGAAASSVVVGSTITNTATLSAGFSPGGQIVFRAYGPGDGTCANAPAYEAAVAVDGNGTYRSAAFAPAKVGTYRWTIAYSGDPSHAPAATGCGAAASQAAPAQPSISGAVPPRVTVGTAFSDTAALRGGFAPRGTITFRIYGPDSSGCAKPAFVNTVAVNGNGIVSSDPFVALRPGRYSFVASYSGDAANQSSAEPCDSPAQVVRVGKRAPRVKPRAVLVGGKQISIRARLAGGVAPAGALTFRLYGPDDRRCTRKPVFSGGISVKRNGTFSLGRYLATKTGTYRLSVGYSGDKRNQRYEAGCSGAQSIRVK